MATYIPNGTLIKRRREELGMTQLDLAEASGLQERTIQRLEAGEAVRLDTMRAVSSALGENDFHVFVSVELYQRQFVENQSLINTSLMAIHRAMWWVNSQLERPWTQTRAQTLRTKSTTHALADDQTDSIDQVASHAIRQVLTQASLTPGDPLSNGFLCHNEEEGLHPFMGLTGGLDNKLIAFIDPVDFTDAARLGIDGSVLISFFRQGFGMCSAVVGDLFRNRIYYRVAGQSSQAFKFEFREDPAHPFAKAPVEYINPGGQPLILKTTDRSTLRGAAVNMYMGKPDRVIMAANNTGTLFHPKTGIKATFSVGGSLGTVRVGAGLWDASIETAKGFRPWDFCPGAFVADGVDNSAVVDLDGTPISFGPTLVKDAHIEAAFMGEALDGCRLKFVVAATDALAREIVASLKTDARKGLKEPHRVELHTEPTTHTSAQTQTDDSGHSEPTH